MTSLSKKPVAKKRGRPAGSKNKSKPSVFPKRLNGLKLVMKKTDIAVPDVSALKAKIAELETIRERLHSVIDRQEYKAVQYQAVIDYLETKLELK